jgi:hypothetical protein
MQGVLHLRKKEGVQPSTPSYTSLSTMLQGDIPASKQASKQTSKQKMQGMARSAKEGKGGGGGGGLTHRTTANSLTSPN